MVEVKKLLYQEEKYKDIFIEMENDLKQYFKDFPEDVDFYKLSFTNTIKGKTRIKRLFEVYSNGDLVGFLAFSDFKEQFLLRFFYFSSSVKRREVLKDSLRQILQEIRSDNSPLIFDNAAFSFPEEYLSNAFAALDIKYLARTNMILEDYQVFEKSKKDYLVETIIEGDFPKLAKIGCEAYKGTVDLSFQADKISPEAYLEYLTSEFKEYANFNCSLKLLSENSEFIGFILVENDYDNEVLIQEIAINPQYQNQGYGGILMQEAIAKVAKEKKKRIVLTVTNKSVKAKHLYQSLGFKEYSENMRIINH